MLVACRLAGLSALGAHYAGLNPHAGSMRGFRASQQRRGRCDVLARLRRAPPRLRVDLPRLAVL